MLFHPSVCWFELYNLSQNMCQAGSCCDCSNMGLLSHKQEISNFSYNSQKGVNGLVTAAARQFLAQDNVARDTASNYL